jgi:hypothetical protein
VFVECDVALIGDAASLPDAARPSLRDDDDDTRASRIARARRPACDRARARVALRVNV